MATEPTAADDVKIDLIEDDDEFEEFEINEGKSTKKKLHVSILCCCSFFAHVCSVSFKLI